MSKRRLVHDDILSDEPEHRASKVARTMPESPLSRPITKVLSWNVENPIPFIKLPSQKTGSASQPGTHPKFLRECVDRHEYPEFVCLQEIRARQTDKEWISALHKCINAGGKGPKYSMYTSLNRSTRGQRHFGVVTFAKHPEDVAVAREVDWDAEGRVVILEMKQGWALVNVYALNGSEYAWKDPLGKGTSKTRNERKREFNRLLMQECQLMRARGLRLVLIGDFNISLTERDCYPRLRTEHPHGLARKEFLEQFIRELDVVDIFRELYGNRASYSWFAKGKPQGQDCARVDYALIERPLIPLVLEVAYLEDPKERAHSDHAPLVLTLDTEGLSRLRSEAALAGSIE